MVIGRTDPGQKKAEEHYRGNIVAKPGEPNRADRDKRHGRDDVSKVRDAE